MKDFLKESFKNGNRYTNIGITIITGLLIVIGFFLKDIYASFQSVQKMVQQHETDIRVLQADLNHLENQNQTK